MGGRPLFAFFQKSFTMAIKLSSNPTCVLSDADNLTPEQRQKINLNLSKGIPGSDIEGDKVTVINSEGEVEMKAYSAGGSSSYTAGDGIDITDDTISVKVDSSSISINPFGGYLQASQDGKVALISTTSDSIYAEVSNAILQRRLPVLVTDDRHYGTLYKVYELSPGNYQYYFWSTDYVDNGGMGGTTIIVDENGYSPSYRITYSMPFWNSDSDEGKVLKIVNGTPTWVTP
jgi:hypothetical protein